jgi:hypothetical protein
MAYSMHKVSKKVHAPNRSNILPRKKDVTFSMMLSLVFLMIGSGATGWFFANTISQFFISYSLLGCGVFIFTESLFWRFH